MNATAINQTVEIIPLLGYELKRRAGIMWERVHFAAVKIGLQSSIHGTATAGIVGNAGTANITRLLITSCAAMDATSKRR